MQRGLKTTTYLLRGRHALLQALLDRAQLAATATSAARYTVTLLNSTAMTWSGASGDISERGLLACSSKALGLLAPLRPLVRRGQDRRPGTGVRFNIQYRPVHQNIWFPHPAQCVAVLTFQVDPKGKIECS